MGYLRQNQIEEIENEKHVIERTLENRRDIQDRSNLQNTITKIDRQLEDQAPPDLTPEERDQKTRECREIEGRLVPLMPSDEEMRRNPPGVVGRHKKYEKASKSKVYFPEGDIFHWKDCQLALRKGDDDPDIANFERMRPLHNMGTMLGAQIPGKVYVGTNPSEAYKAGHDRTFGPNGNEATSVEASAAETEEVEEPETRKRQPATRKKVTRKKKRTRAANKKSPVLTALACGKMMGPSGRHFHVKRCETCQEAAKE